MIQRIENTIYEKESLPKHDLSVDFVRHGKPTYSEEDIKSGKIEGELTPQGRDDVEKTAMDLSNSIDKANELVIIWTSPKRRAVQTSEIIENILKLNGVTVIKSSTIKSLTDVKMSPEYIDGLVKNDHISDWMEYWSAQEGGEGAEPPAEVKKRVQRVITYLERIARAIDSGSKKLRFICVGHEEVFRDLLEEGYGAGTQAGTGPGYGEVLSMGINKSAGKKNAMIDLRYRGEKSLMEFDKDKREFSKV